MEGQQFDRLTRHFTASLSRRRLGGGLALVGLRTAWRDSAGVAAGRNKKKKKNKTTKKCQKGAARCGAKCVAIKTNNDHCGECNAPCTGGTICQGGQCLPDGNCDPACRADQLCEQGACVCPPGQISCGQPARCRECCFDLHCDGNANGSQCVADPGQPGNLICGCRQLAGSSPVLPCGPDGSCSLCCGHGECVQRSGEGWTCVFADGVASDIGACRCDVQNGYTPCSNRCSNLQTSTTDCGACDFRCDSSDQEVCCGGVCTDVRSNDDHCGRCGNACPGSGPTSTTCCSGECVNIREDPTNCGGCGEVCPAERPDCCLQPNGLAHCTDLTWDPRNCGVCRTVCGAEETCCDSVCFNLSNDQNNCGECFVACPVNHLCEEGDCVPVQVE